MPKISFCCNPRSSRWLLHVIGIQLLYIILTGLIGPSFQWKTRSLNQTRQWQGRSGPSFQAHFHGSAHLRCRIQAEGQDASPTCSAPPQGPSPACVLLRISLRKSGPGGRTRELPCRATVCSDTGSPPFRSDALWDFPSDPVRKVRKRCLEAEYGHSGWK